MTRPIFTITLGSISGIIMGVYLIKSIPIIFVFLITCIFFIWIKYKIYRKTILVFFVSLCIFIVISHKINYNYDNKYKELNEKEIKVVGQVI